MGTALAENPPTLPTNPESSLTQSQSSSQTENATNSVDQDASSTAISAPGVQSNVNAPVNGSGDSGAVTQSNSSTANSGASNQNESVQGIDQDQGSTQSQSAESQGGCCTTKTTSTNGPSQPSADQTQRSNQSENAKNKVDQDANSSATSAPGVQSNVNAPVRVGSNGNNNARTRTEAFRRALAERGIPVHEDWIVGFRWRTSQTRLLMRRLFTQKEPPTALLAWNDYCTSSCWSPRHET